MLRIMSKIEVTKMDMVENIDTMIARGDQLNELSYQAEELHSQSQSFHRKTRQLSWWEALVDNIVYYFQPEPTNTPTTPQD